MSKDSFAALIGSMGYHTFLLFPSAFILSQEAHEPNCCRTKNLFGLDCSNEIGR